MFLVLPGIASAQQKSIITLQSSTRLNGSVKDNISYVRNPVFVHDATTLICDSAVFYKARNYFEAFDNVHIIQGDTVNIYSDQLTYDGNTKLAHLTGNVRMITPTSTLTTNILDYNTGTKIGQYFDKGKIVNTSATIVSQRGWYFANTRDAYFRYDVLVTTPQTTITSDTLRYNTASNWTYFYGPTNIKGKDDKLYTENGAYNTKSDNAYFGKRNLYTNGSRSLKGDSLYYFGKRGYGRAVKNIVFVDTTDKMVLRGQLGEYYKATEKIVVTQHAYIGMDSKDSATVNNKKIPDTLWLGADTLAAQKTMRKNLSIVPRPIVLSDADLAAAEKKAAEEKEKEKAEAQKAMAEEAKKQEAVTPPTPSTNKKLSKKELKKLAEEKTKLPPIDTAKKIADSLLAVKQVKLKDSLVADSLIKLKNKLQKDSADLANLAKKVPKKQVKELAKLAKQLKTDDKTLKDTVKPFNPADTVRIREIRAYHNVRLFKSNMQAKADSLYFNAADSCLRWFKDPILWGEGSQQTGDTILVFFRDKKIHSFQVTSNGFLVNIDGDSTKFNQVKGRKMTGFFTDGSLKNMYVDGNAESIYYTKKSNGEYDNVNQSLSSRIKFLFDKKELSTVSMYRQIEGKADPIDSVKKENVLTGFVWKPELRPTSKADVIKGKPASKKTSVAKAIGKPGANTKGKTASKATTIKKQLDSNMQIEKTLSTDVVDSLKVSPLIDSLIKVKPKTDSVIKQASKLTPALKLPPVKKQ